MQYPGHCETLRNTKYKFLNCITWCNTKTWNNKSRAIRHKSLFSDVLSSSRNVVIMEISWSKRAFSSCFILCLLFVYFSYLIDVSIFNFNLILIWLLEKYLFLKVSIFDFNFYCLVLRTGDCVCPFWLSSQKGDNPKIDKSTNQ